jgi:hypothetical protein
VLKRSVLIEPLCAFFARLLTLLSVRRPVILMVRLDLGMVLD